MATEVSQSTYDVMRTQRDTAFNGVTQSTAARDQAEANRIIWQRQLDDLTTIIADLTVDEQ